MLSKNRFANIKIGTKFNLLLIIVFIIGIFSSSIVFAKMLEQRAQYEVTSQGLVLMETMNSVRNYTQNYVNPLLKNRLETEETFIPQAIPTFSVREVFEGFRKHGNYQDFFYKDAALNPTNLRDKADSFETKLVQRFRQTDIKEVSGFRPMPEGQMFYIARPFEINDQKCLQCHSTPALAPKSMLATYGAQNGFGWKLHEIVAAQVVYVPSEAVFKNAKQLFTVVMGVIVAIFFAVILLINYLLKNTVIQRIKHISKTAQAVSIGEMSAEFEEHSKDEIGILVTAFNRMKSSLAIAMDLLNHQR